MKIRITPLSRPSGLHHHLDNPKQGQVANGAKLTISGWAYAAGQPDLRMTILRNGNRQVMERNTLRPDVSAHLRRNGFHEHLDIAHGYRFDIDNAEDIQIGVEMDGRTHWLYKLTHATPVRFHAFPTIAEMIAAPSARGGTIVRRLQKCLFPQCP